MQLIINYKLKYLKLRILSIVIGKKIKPIEIRDSRYANIEIKYTNHFLNLKVLLTLPHPLLLFFLLILLFISIFPLTYIHS